MRLVLLSIVVVLAGLSSTARGGEDPNAGPPALSDEAADKPTVKQAMAAARAFLRAMRSEELQPKFAAVTVPIGISITGGGTDDDQTEHCFDNTRYTDEGEGLPGTPQCLAAALATHARGLEKALAKSAVVSTLKAADRKGKIGDQRIRDLLKPLVNHRFVVLRKGKVRVVIAVRASLGEPKVDAVLVSLPRRKPTTR